MANDREAKKKLYFDSMQQHRSFAIGQDRWQWAASIEVVTNYSDKMTKKKNCCADEELLSLLVCINAFPGIRKHFQGGNDFTYAIPCTLLHRELQLNCN